MTDGAEKSGPSILSEVPDVPERALRTYARLWQFENWLRRMVYVELRALLGDDWAKPLNADPRHFNKDKHLKHMPTPEMNELSYSQLSKLIELVEKHWNCFEVYLPPKELWNAKLKEISQIRHRVAHFRSGHADDYTRLLQFLRDIDKGFWTFCTSYNCSKPILPQTKDPVTEYFFPLDPLPWGEIEPNKWMRVGQVNHSPVIGVVVEVLTRPCAAATQQVVGEPGHLYDITLLANDNRFFDYGKLLEQTQQHHKHAVHLCLDSPETSLRLTLPTVLGARKVIEMVEAIVETAHFNVARWRNPLAPDINDLAAEWPEYVLGPSDPMTYLDPTMKCTFFNA